VISPDSVGFKIYFEYIEEKITESSWNGNGIISYYDTENPFAGDYSLKWSDGAQYNYLGFDFRPDKDLSYLVGNGYAVDFRVKGNSPGASFDIRFLDTKTNEPGDHPWRMRYTINEQVAAWDGEWHHVNIPLTNFTEQGSWDDNTWYNPIGAFDWKAVDRFQIVAEQMDMSGIEFSFDNILITDIPVSVNDRLTTEMDEDLIKIGPNPVYQDMTVIYTVEENGPVEISIFNLIGQKIVTMVDEEKTAGNYTLTWNFRGDNNKSISGGIYFCRLTESGEIMTRKIIIAGN
jgi:endoglucanase